MRKLFCSIVGCLGCAVGTTAYADEPAFTNGTFIGTANRNAFAATASWQDGVVPGGAGATVTINGNANLTLPPTWSSTANAAFPDVTLGHIVMPDSSGAHQVNIQNGYDKFAGTTEWDGRTNHRRTRHLVMDSGDVEAPATITFHSSDDMRRSQICPDLLLRSDLEISFLSSTPLKSNLDNYYDNLCWFYFYGGIHEDGAPHGLAFRNTYGAAKKFALWGDSTFSGDVSIESNAIVRLCHAGRLGGPSSQLGRNNTISVKDGGQVQLGAYTMGAGQTLELNGMTERSPVYGWTYNPAYIGEWQGAVKLNASSSVDGVGGGLRLSGTVSGTGPFVKTGVNTLYLEGANTHTGGLRIDNGFVSIKSDDALGADKTIAFNGGGLLLDGAYDPFASGSVTCTGTVRLRVEDDRTATLSKGIDFSTKAAFQKSGNGTLVVQKSLNLNNNSYQCGGRVVLDYATNDVAGPFLNGSWFYYLVGGTLELQGGTKAISEGCLCLMGDGYSTTPGALKVRMTGVEGSKFKVADNRAYFSNRYPAGRTIDLKYQEGTYFYGYRDTVLGDTTTLANLRVTLDEGRSFAAFDSEDPSSTKFMPSQDMKTEWSTTANRLMDVTAVNASAMPDGAKVYALRFNDPAVATLTLPGAVTLANGAILVTPDSGTDDDDGEIVITGGSLTAGNNEIVVHQWNTNRTLRIVSPIVNNGGSAVRFTKSGPGTVVLDPGVGVNTFSSTLAVADGILEVNGQNAMSVTNRQLWIVGGATLRVKGDVRHGYYSGQTSCFGYDEAGGIVETPTASDTFTLIGWVDCTAGARIVKTGKGTFNWSLNSGWCRAKADPVYVGSGASCFYFKHFDVRDGLMDFSKSDYHGIDGGQSSVIHLSNGAMVRGASVLGRSGGSDNTEGRAGSITVEVGEGGGKFDVNGGTSSGSFSLGSNTGSYWNNVDNIWGEGAFELVNTSTTYPTVKLSPDNWQNWFFAGTLAWSTNVFPYYVYGSGGLGLCNGTLGVRQDEKMTLKGAPYSYLAGDIFRFGTLTGGMFTVTAQWDNPSVVKEIVVGRDRDETFTLAPIGFNPDADNRNQDSPTHSPPTGFVKVGSNTMRIVESNNYIRGAFRVRKGTVLVAADSPGKRAGKNGYGFATNNGALGNNNVYVGDWERQWAGEAKLLTDAAVAIGNDVIVPAEAEESVTIGGNSASASAYTGKLTLERDVKLHAESGTVTFGGKVSGVGAVTKTGPGKVVLSDAEGVRVGGVEAGELELAKDAELGGLTVTAASLAAGAKITAQGGLAIAADAVLDLSGVDFSTLAEQNYPLVGVSGGAVTGTFAEIRGLPANGKWQVKAATNGIRLMSVRGFTLILK